MVDRETFLRWAVGHFGSDNIRLRDSGEILANSPYTSEPDGGMNLWMNPDGGKKKLENGAFRCWKTDRKGSLVWLVSDLDNISYEDAEELLCGITSLRRLEREVELFFGTATPEPFQPEAVTNPVIDFPPHTYLIDDLSRNHPHRLKAEEYLTDRGLPTEGLHVCTRGDFRDRIIIPYYDKEGGLIYYNARTLSKKEGVLRYMKPEDKTIDQNKFLYFTEWPIAGMKLYITEGEFDALSLGLAGMYGSACGGKHLTPEQIELIRPYVPVVATDNDSNKRQNSGMEALIAIGNKLLASGFREVYYVRPPLGYKDWNELLKAKGKDLLRAYIQKFQKPFTGSTEGLIRASQL